MNNALYTQEQIIEHAQRMFKAGIESAGFTGVETNASLHGNEWRFVATGTSVVSGQTAVFNYSIHHKAVARVMKLAADMTRLGNLMYQNGRSSAEGIVEHQLLHGTGNHWRCFHCDEVFTTKNEAELHFGKPTTFRNRPACRLSVIAYRQMEDRMRRYCEEDTDLHRRIHAMQADHSVALMREEEKGYERGLRDGMKLFEPVAQVKAVSMLGVSSPPSKHIDPLSGVELQFDEVLYRKKVE